MKIKTVITVGLLLVTTAIYTGCATSSKGGNQTVQARPANRSGVDQILATWPKRPRLAAYRNIQQLPQEATLGRLIWLNNGPVETHGYKRHENPAQLVRSSSAITESFDEPLSKPEVLKIVNPFGRGSLPLWSAPGRG